MALNEEGVFTHCKSNHNKKEYPFRPFCQYCEVHYLRSVVEELKSSAVKWHGIASDTTDDLCREIKHKEAAQKRAGELQDFAIWMTGCGYDFCKLPYFNEQRDKLLI